MALKCFMLDLKDDPALIAAYRDWHKPGGPPRSVTQTIRAHGVREMMIFLSGNRLCMLIDADAAFDGEAKRASEAANPEALWAGSSAWTRFSSRLGKARSEMGGGASDLRALRTTLSA